MPAVESGLVDLSGISLEALRSLDDTTFTESLEQLLHHIDGPQAITLSYSPSRFD
ncbi:hypothetical protein ACPCBC_01550 [Streptomyces incarnatus]|uniref:hypothetical protein n=1 Tax=unclassified Streptomyces TaxID=2593676 RepID=UPI00131882CE|nr:MULTISPECIES: hypothetical protein [Streptomyces]QHC32399.1 hypothetical protein GR129_30020 [Streptomyces sp. HF10]WKE68572.1 hypothetical protein QHG49_05785 [Streptomyces sp. WP-1]